MGISILITPVVNAEEGLVAHWKFDGGSGIISVDEIQESGEILVKVETSGCFL